MVAHEHSGCCGPICHDAPLPAATEPEDTSPPHPVDAEIDVSKDKGVTKKVLVQGTGSR